AASAIATWEQFPISSRSESWPLSMCCISSSGMSRIIKGKPTSRSIFTRRQMLEWIEVVARMRNSTEIHRTKVPHGGHLPRAAGQQGPRFRVRQLERHPRAEENEATGGEACGWLQPVCFGKPGSTRRE